MAFLDELLRLGTPNLAATASTGNPANVVQQQEAMLSDLLNRLSTEGVNFPGTEVAAQPWVAQEAPPSLEPRNIKAAPLVGQPYQPPAPEVTQTRPDFTRAPSPAPVHQRSPVRQPAFNEGPDFGEILSALGRGYEKGGLLGGIGDAMRLSRSYDDTNRTVNWLMRQGGMDLDTARIVASQPDVMKSILTSRLSPEKTTDELREYRFDVQQRLARGESPDQIPTFAQWKAELRRAGATQVNVNPGEKSFIQEMGKKDAQFYDGLQSQAENARNMLGMYDLAENAINTGIRTGALGEHELTLRQFGQMLGIDTDANKVAGGELLRSVQNKMALMMRSPDGGMGMPGALSDRDIKFLKDAQIGLDRTPEGNRRMLQAFRATEQRKLDIARLADEYIQQHGKLDRPGFNAVVRRFAEENPLFTPETFDESKAGGASGGYRVLGVR